TFAPDGGYGSYNGQSVFTHGIELGVTRNETHDLETATDELIDSLHEGNPQMTRPSGYRRTTLAGRNGLVTQFENVSEVTGQRELIELRTGTMPDGSLLYFIAVAP